MPLSTQILQRSTGTHRPARSGSSEQETSHHAPLRPHLTLGDSGLTRHGTLLTSNATPARAAAELKSMLGNHSARLKTKAALIRMDSGSAAFNRHVTLEQAKRRARVEVDILPQTEVCVQGGHFRGHVRIFVRKATRKEVPVFIAGGKIRVVGFESIGDKPNAIFYQCSAMLASVTPSLEGLYTSERDPEGFAQAKEGEHEFPFALYLSLSNDNGQARGVLRNHSGIALSYIAMVSLKIKDEPGRRSITHFYRYIEIWPRLDPTVILATALRPLQATVSTNVAKNSDAGRIKLTASLHRLHWVAGQFCQVKIIVDNDTPKPLKELTLSLFRTTAIFPHSASDGHDLDLGPPPPEVSTKRVAESVLGTCQPRSKGHASTKGWWLGVRPRQYSEFEHSILIPIDALTIPRGRNFEIEYSLRVALDSGTRLSSDIQVMLPIRIVGFLSIDPPPSQPISTFSQMPTSFRPPSSRQSSKATSSGPGSFHIFEKSGSASRVCEETGKRLSIEQYAMTDTGKGKDLPDHTCDRLRYEQGTDEPSSDWDEELGDLGLGNLSLADDGDDVVQHAITTARVDLNYGRFSDLYYFGNERSQIEGNDASLKDSYESSVFDSDSAEGVLETLMNEVAMENDSDVDICGVETNLAHRILGARSHSSFAARVEEKTRIATAAFLKGDRDGRAHQEQREALTKCAQEGYQSGKPYLTLKIPPVPSGEYNQSARFFSNASQHPSARSWETSTNSQEDDNSYYAPMRRGLHSPDLTSRRPSPKRHRTASTIGLSTPGISSGSSIHLLSTPPLHRNRESMPMTSASIYSHYAMENSAAKCGLSPGHVGGENAGERPKPDSGLDTDTSLPHVHGSTTCIDVVKATTASAQTLISPTSATSTTSAASIGSVSVKDKVRQLEERVKASAII
ncbi:hypothetical protein D9756_005957 [Leucocoprinus leucothites]|uniref:Arrestin C-terminal-like domain-containing protein n=1 Tax=Leucocoprinus leucothites TaxID=201217 RepID=A0A8H5D2X3_9AGAR|nr:hypothetical protein D9756_005957 [Leucoagaricus leucothites]